MLAVLLTIHVLLAIGLISLVLIQHGKGADAGAAFGSGASGTVFGSQGGGSFLVKATTGLAILFFFSSLGMAYMVDGSGSQGSVTEVTAPAPADSETPGKGQPSDVPSID